MCGLPETILIYGFPTVLNLNKL